MMRRFNAMFTAGRIVLLLIALLVMGGVMTAIAAQLQESQEQRFDHPKGEPVKPKYSASGYDITPLPREQVEQLASTLDPETYRITQKAGTEPAFCGNLLDNKKDGVYVCVVCGLPLFASEHKFHSGTGWPSFYREFDPEHVSRQIDRSHGMVRTEITCARCGSHLGPVFPDCPPPTGARLCRN